jgi:hypothetical protein
MKTAAVIVVLAGVIAAALAGATSGLDATSLLLLGAIVAVGALAIALVRKMGAGSVAPARCRGCGGLISATAPYCKHCLKPT